MYRATKDFTARGEDFFCDKHLRVSGDWMIRENYS